METKKEKGGRSGGPKLKNFPHEPKADPIMRWEAMSGPEIDYELLKEIKGRKVIIKIKDEDWAIAGTITFIGEKFFWMEFVTRCDWKGSFHETMKSMEEACGLGPEFDNLEELTWILLRKEQIGQMTSYAGFTSYEESEVKAGERISQ